MKHIIILIIMSLSSLLLLVSCGNDNAADSQTETLFNGVIEAQAWTKNTESYCHGGGDYFVLQTSLKRYILNSLRDPGGVTVQNNADFEAMQTRFQELTGTEVQVTGNLITRTFSEEEHCPDPFMQCISGPITCTWLQVDEIDIK